jgi:hypothetical protein
MMIYLDLMNFWTSLYQTFIQVCLETLFDVGLRQSLVEVIINAYLPIEESTTFYL